MLTPELRMSPINGSSAVQVYAITALPFAFAIAFHVYILPQARRSVTVMPHSDAASSVCSRFVWRIGCFLDAASRCGMTVTDCLD